MTLDQAIQHAQEVADNPAMIFTECAADHRQLAKWLRELKAYRKAFGEILDEGQCCRDQT